MSNIHVSTLVGLFKAGRDHTLQILDSVPESHRMKQLTPGKATPTWLLGHLARTVDRLILEWVLLEEPILSEVVGIRFAPEHTGGFTPTTNSSDYPSWEELRAAYIEITDRAVAGLGKLTDADLEKPVPGDLAENYRERFSSIGVLMRLLPNHDAYHRGQIGLIAKLD